MRYTNRHFTYLLTYLQVRVQGGEYKYKYKYLGIKYKYKYKYSTFKYKYEYKYLESVL